MRITLQNKHTEQAVVLVHNVGEKGYRQFNIYELPTSSQVHIIKNEKTPENELSQKISIEVSKYIDKGYSITGVDINDNPDDLAIKSRLDYLRRQVKAECMSYADIAELQSLSGHIDEGDTELLE